MIGVSPVEKIIIHIPESQTEPALSKSAKFSQCVWPNRFVPQLCLASVPFGNKVEQMNKQGSLFLLPQGRLKPRGG